LAADPELSARIEGWPRAAIRLLTAADGLVRVHLLVDGTARVERFGRDGRWLESEFAFWADDGRKHTDSSLAEVLEAFGVAQPDAIATAAEMRSAAEPLVGPKGSRWSDLLFYFGWWGVLASGWIAAIVLAIVVLVVLL
jgi:hypothetical protein